MELKVATALISDGVPVNNRAHWMDLGAGDGLFTEALAGLLAKGSTIVAVDKGKHDYSSIERNTKGGITIHAVQQDFTDEIPMTEKADGILMANALHFVRDQSALLLQLSALLKPDGRLIIVEYNIENGNRWVPYPVGFNALKQLAASTWGTTPARIGEAPSAYHSGGIYSAVLIPYI